MTLQLRHIKKCQWNRGWYVQLTEWIKPITVSKLKFKWMCFPRGGPPVLFSAQGGDETLEMNAITLMSLVFFSPAQMPSRVREKRQSHISMCYYCCNCCRANKGCGYCCKFWRPSPLQRPPHYNLLRFLDKTTLFFLTSFSDALTVPHCFCLIFTRCDRWESRGKRPTESFSLYLFCMF